MTFDELANEKRADIRAKLSTHLTGIPQKTRDAILDQFVVVEPPAWALPGGQAHHPAREYKRIGAGPGGSGGGHSLKPGNIRLDLNGLLAFLSNATLTATALTDQKYVATAAIISIVTSVVAVARGLKVSLSEEETTVLWGIYHAGGYSAVREAEVVERTNQERTHHALGLLSQSAVDHAIDRLLDLKCLRRPYLGAIMVAESLSVSFGTD